MVVSFKAAVILVLTLLVLFVFGFENKLSPNSGTPHTEQEGLECF
jgi:hypothetical protein